MYKNTWTNLNDRNNSSPQGDGNAWRSRSAAWRMRETIHPRKGTETSPRSAAARVSGNNSSPQGDGNFTLHRDNVNTEETIHPRKGTETKCGSPARVEKGNNSSPQGDGNRRNFSRLNLMRETIHPRKGTETPFIRILYHFSRFMKQFIPARGRKRAYSQRLF